MRLGAALWIIVLASVAGVALLAFLWPRAMAGPSGGHAGHDLAHLDDAASQRAVDEWYAQHPRTGGQGTSGAPSSPDRVLGIDRVVNATGTRFDADGSALTQVDTVRITTGQTVQWVRINSIHTVTSGTGSSDPNAGLIFDAPLNATTTQFQFTFTTPEVVHYFCQPHESDNMRGVIIVSAPVGVEPPPPDATVGFASEPWPNPSPTGIQFRFRLAEPGHVRADVMDARGRFVATVVDRAYDAGTYAAAWDGRTSGVRAASGTYYLRLRVPGFVGGRSVVVTH